jgi:hypothetical protein
MCHCHCQLASCELVTLIVAMRHLSTLNVSTTMVPHHMQINNHHAHNAQRRRGGEWEIRETTALARARDSSESLKQPKIHDLILKTANHELFCNI